MPLTSAERKFERGIEHVHTLRREAKTFQDANAYEPLVERKVRTPQEIEYRVSAQQNLAVPDHWPVLAGEAIYNLRSALDHAVYALIRKNRGQSQYPIFTDRREFQVKGRPMIKGLSETVRTLIEEGQPYNRLEQYPAFDPLAILNSFSNRDKHRQLATVAAVSDFTYVGVNDGVKISEWIMPLAVGKVLQQDTEVVRFVAVAATEIKEMDVNPRFTYQVRIRGRPLVDGFRAIANRVYECLVELETGEKVDPWLQGYPVVL